MVALYLRQYRKKGKILMRWIVKKRMDISIQFSNLQNINVTF